MKWFALIVGLGSIAPIALLLRRYTWLAPWLWTVVGFLPFVLTSWHLNMAPISKPEWPGHVTGLEISALDFLVLALFLGSPGFKRSYPFLLSMVLYVLALAVSTALAPFPTVAFFHFWEMLRVLLLAAVLARGCADPRVAPAVLFGLALGLGLQFFVCLSQRASGVIQTTGTLSHQNMLGLISNAVAILFFGVFMARPALSKSAILPLLGMAIATMTASRGAMLFFLLGCVVVFVVSYIRMPTGRKTLVAVVGVTLAAVGVMFAMASFEQRFAAAPLDGTYDERAAFEKAAGMMIRDYPFGIGDNHYTFIANVKGYSDNAGVAAIEGSRSAKVHNVFLLTWAETGYLGLATFLFMLFQPVVTALRCGWRHRDDLRGDLLLGAGIALLTTYVHSFFEWIFIANEPQYVFAMICGLIAGVAQQLNYWPACTKPAQLATPSRLLQPQATPA